jgi:phosphatidylglycerol---prolipoprotein diacylglyceryl transferase
MYPVLFSLGETPIHSYGFLIAIALILGWIVSLRFARLDKLPADLLGTGYVLSVGGGLLAARMMWLFQHPGQAGGGIAALLQLQAGGLSGFGGVMAGLIIAGVFCQNKKVPPWAWLDCAAPAFLLGVLIERLGAFLAGADFGHYVDHSFFMAVQFPADSVVWDVHRRELSGLRVPGDQSLPVHPSQLYAAAAAAVAAGLAFVIRGRRQYSGQVALFSLASFGVIRYLIEDPFRYDMTPEIAGPITLGQLTGVVIVVVAVLAHSNRLGKAQEDPASARQWLGGPWTPGAEGEAKPGASKSGKTKSGKKKSGKKKSSTKTTKPAAASEPAGKADGDSPTDA